MTTAWVCEKISDDHTRLPELTSTAAAVGKAPAAGAPAAVAATTLPPLTSEPESIITPLDVSPVVEQPKVEETKREGGAIGKIGAGVFGALAVAAGAYLFAWPALSNYLNSEPEQIAFAAPDPDAVPTQRMVIEGDTLYLEGSVPDQTISDSIEAMATEALGEDRVVNNLDIDSDAVYREDAQVPLSVAETVLFSTGQADVGTQYQDLIDLSVGLMASQENVSLTVIGHTDDVGDAQLNLDLSLQRAQATADEFVRRGIDASRLSVEGRGETEPIATNDTEEGRSTNRRVEFLITGLGG